ncbi:hypothetical protein SCHPADRAFT_269792 [Schizopora paradoxa]|uniref:Uncharacterized protein n=1 Tax=Schizopora paradoxa TaxID=27342 RepID=A0A0H2S0M0_9AGAM|nr:hypothetical protein SCHPADRAFT_269792 [Schizopora paradoxa]
MEGHPVPRKLETDMHDVVSSWLARDHPIPEHWKPHTDPINAMPYSELRDLGVKGCTDLARQTRDTAMRLESLSRTFHALSGAIYTEYRSALDNFVAATNMASLITLPNETLSRIFEFVVNGDDEFPVRARRDAAVTLSHICKYFRDTALSCAELWANITGNSDLAALCLSRSKNVPLDLDVRIGYSQRGIPETYHFTFDKLLQEALNHSNRWRSLRIQYMFCKGFDDSDTDFIRGSEFTEAFRGLDAPSLESLLIESNSSLLGACYAYTELEGWRAPNLRFATFEHYFPLRFPALANVTNLVLSHRLGQIPLDELVKDLSRMTSLEELNLTIYGGAFPNPDANPTERTYLPSVKILKIYVHHAGMPFGMMSPTRALFSSLFFPELEDLNVTLHGQFQKKYDASGFEDNG